MHKFYLAILGCMIGACGTHQMKPIAGAMPETELASYDSRFSGGFLKPEHFVVKKYPGFGTITKLKYQDSTDSSPAERSKRISSESTDQMFRTIDASGIWDDNIRDRNRYDLLDAPSIVVTAKKGSKKKVIYQYGLYDAVLDRLHEMLRREWEQSSRGRSGSQKHRQ